MRASPLTLPLLRSGGNPFDRSAIDPSGAGREGPGRVAPLPQGARDFNASRSAPSPLVGEGWGEGYASGILDSHFSRSVLAMLDVSPLWPADLHHIRIDSPDPVALAAFYARAMGMQATPL